MKETRTILNMRDLWFTVVAIPKGYTVEFNVYHIVGFEENGDILWQKKDSEELLDPTGKLEDAQLYLHGKVKFTGCSDWYFDEQDRLALHACTKDELRRFSEVMARCWDIAMTFAQQFGNYRG